MKRTVRTRENTFKPGKVKPKVSTETKDFPGYPKYPAEEDIYEQSQKTYMDTDDPDHPRMTSENEKENVRNHRAFNFEDDRSGEDLDIPGAELDNEQEDIGSEDEENNYYSLGGDGHNDLEENTGRE